MFGITGIPLYIIIFFGKATEVSLSTIRTVLITKGEKTIGAVIGFFEVLLWVFVVSSILTNLSEDPLKIVAYALGFTFGVFIGSVLEEKIGLGTKTIMAVVDEEDGCILAESLRKHDLGVTVLKGMGMDSKKSVLMIIVKRKESQKVINLIKKYNSKAVITTSETKPICGGYGSL